MSNHDELMSNFFAQPDALAYGKVHIEWLEQKFCAYMCFVQFLAFFTETDYFFSDS